MMSFADIFIRSISGYIFIVPGIILYFLYIKKIEKRQTPKANSIAVWVKLSPNGTEPDEETAPGHVGYVEKVSGEYVYISEANWDLDGENPNPETDGIIRRFTISDIKSRKTKYNGTYKLVGYLEL